MCETLNHKVNDPVFRLYYKVIKNFSHFRMYPLIFVSMFCHFCANSVIDTSFYRDIAAEGYHTICFLNHGYCQFLYIDVFENIDVVKAK